jgi:signal transduction histidine kinase
MLKRIAEVASASGCILWQVAPGTHPEANPLPPSARLSVLAEWFQHNQGTAIHDLPLDKSVTGKAIMGGKSLSIDDIWDEKNGVYNNDPFLKQAEIKTMCSIPIQFHVRVKGKMKQDVIQGALNLYRDRDEKFEESEILQLEQLAFLVPALYQTIRNEVSFRLIESINDLLHKAEIDSPKIPLSKEKMIEVIKQICVHVSESLQCVETSIFMEDQFESPGIYELIATTWVGHFNRRRYRKGDKGLSGWVLSNKRAVRIFDLGTFKRDRKLIYNVEYPKISWTDSLGFRTTIRERLNLKADDILPPLSFIAAPIVEGEEVYGLIRCSIAKEGPHYFGERELELLKLVAAQISHYWSNWLHRRELHEEVESWRSFVESVGKLNGIVRIELGNEVPNENYIFAEALKNTEAVISGAEIMDVRLRDPEKPELYFAEKHGKAWTDGSESEIQERLGKRYPLDSPPKSAGARVFQTGNAALIEDVQTDHDYSGTFPSTKRIIISPIKVAKEIYGVLDIRGTGKRAFPKHAKAVAELLGQQLGLYRFLAATIGELRQTKTDLRKNVGDLEQLQKQQQQVFEDLNHQLYGPITEAHGRAQDILREEFDKVRSKLGSTEIAERLEDNLLTVRGLCGKTKRVAMSTGLFADLARQEPLPLKIERLQSKLKLRRLHRDPKHVNPDDLVKKLIEAAKDSQYMIEQGRNISFQVKRESFDVLLTHEYYVDYDLLEQAIVNILDNAYKYSYSNTKIHIEGGLTATERFYITITNKGFFLEREEIKECTGRGWRGEKAKQVTGEGSGIGLWIVDYIMHAHRGQLEITSERVDDRSNINRTGFTKIRLLFSKSKVEKIPGSNTYRFVKGA